MKRHRLSKGGALAGMVMLAVAACGGGGDKAPPPEQAAETTTSTAAATTTATTAATQTTMATPTTEAPKPAGEVVTLLAVQSGDAACYLEVKNASGVKQSLPADFELCPGGSADASKYVGRKVELQRRSTKIMADSCQGDPKCTDTKTVDLVVAVKAVS